MNIGKNFGMTREQWDAWLQKYGDVEPMGCIGCGLMAGCCDKYPQCAGSQDWLHEQARRITEELVTCSLAVGKTVQHPDGRTVKVIDGQYWGAHGLSNFWYWREVMADGSLSEKLERGYGW